MLFHPVQLVRIATLDFLRVWPIIIAVKIASSFQFSLPAPILERVEGLGPVEEKDRMSLAIELSALNIRYGGGPFGACIFDMESGELVSVGVNLVVAANTSVAHAEMVAIILAQQAFGTYALTDKGSFELISSAEPCAQCFGAIPWSGVKRVAYGAPRADVEAIGFDEGPKPRAWREKLKDRGIDVVGPLRRNRASAVLREYAKGGVIYNG